MVAPPEVPLNAGRKAKGRAKCDRKAKKRGQEHYKGRSSKASARLAPKSGRDGGRKPRPDNGLPNLTSRPLSVVNIRCSAIKARFDAGRFLL